MSKPHDVLPMVETLCRQFEDSAAKIYKAVTPQESLPSLAAHDPQYEGALAALRLAARFDAAAAVQTLASMRDAWGVSGPAAERMDAAASSPTFLRRSAAEIALMEGALEVVREHRPEFKQDPAMSQFYAFVLSQAFHWLAFNWESSSEGLVPPEALKSRNHLLGVCGRLTSAMSVIHLRAVVDTFVRVLKDRVKPTSSKPNHDALRAQIQRMCLKMRVVLSFGSESDLDDAVYFLERCSPWQYTAAVKKSQIHHSISHMLTEALWPLVWRHTPHGTASSTSSAASPSLARWFDAISRMRTEAWTWVNTHVKHVPDGLPLYTTLVCLLDDRSYSAALDQLLNYLLKVLKGKECRPMCTKCLVQLACSYLNRYGKAMPRLELHKWLDKVFMPLTAVARKGGLTCEEQLDALAPIAELAPDYAVDKLVLDMLTSEVPDCILPGLKALHALVTTLPAPRGDAAGPPSPSRAVPLSPAPSASAAGSSRQLPVGAASPEALGPPSGHPRSPGLAASTPQPRPGGGPRLSGSGSEAFSAFSSVASASAASGHGMPAGAGGGPGGASLSRSGSLAAAVRKGGSSRRVPQEVLDLLRRGSHAFEPLGIAHLQPRVVAALGRILATWHQAHGSSVPSGAGYATALDIFVVLIRLMPFTRPEAWVGGTVRPLDVLHGYTCHPSEAIRSAALEALHTLMLCAPHLRNAVLMGYSAHLAALPDDSAAPLREGLQVLRALMSSWMRTLCDLIEGQGQGPGALEPEIRDASTLTLSVERLEGFGLSMMCSQDEAIRMEALSVLQQVRELHQLLLQAAGLRTAALLLAHPSSACAPPSASLTPFSSAPAPSTPFHSRFTSPLPAPHPPTHRRSTSNPPQLPAPSTPPNTRAGGLGISSGGAGAGGLRGSGRLHFSPSRDSLESVLEAGSVADSATSLTGLSAQQQQQQVLLLPHGLGEGWTYLVELVEESGPEIARECYWDFGEWPDLYKELNTVPDHTPFAALLRARDEVARMRLTRSLVQLAKLAGRLCPGSSACAQRELAARLSRMVARDSDRGRPTVMQEYMDPARVDSWRYAAAVALALPDHSSHPAATSGSSTLQQQQQLQQAQRATPVRPAMPGQRASPTSVLSARDLVRAHLSVLIAAAVAAGHASAGGGAAPGASSVSPSPPPSLQLGSMVALGHAHPSHELMLLEELAPVLDEASRATGGASSHGPTSGPNPSPSSSSASLSVSSSALSKASKPPGSSSVLNQALNFLSDSGEQRAAAWARAYGEELRRLVAHVVRVLADTSASSLPTASLPPAVTPATPGAAGGSGVGLRPTGPSPLHARLLEWVRETYALLKPLPLSGDAFWELVQVAYCLACVVRSLAQPLLLLHAPIHAGPPAQQQTRGGAVPSIARQSSSPSTFRRALWEVLACWSEEGHPSAAEYQAEVRRGLSSQRLGRTDTEGELQQSAGCLSRVCRQAMAALLAGPAFDGDTRNPQGAVLTWIDRLFMAGKAPTSGSSGGGALRLQAAGGRVEEVGRWALLGLLHSNLELLHVCLDRCYDRDSRVARGCFQVLCEVYCTQPQASLSPPLLLSLVLYKMVDHVAEVRDDALHLLHVLTTRHWGPDAAVEEAVSGWGAGGVGDSPLVLVGGLQDTYEGFQLSVSSKYARVHPELSEDVCEEMLTRLLNSHDPTTQQPVLASLGPWVENLSMPAEGWQGTGAERVLKALFLATQQHGEQFPGPMGALWSTLAAEGAGQAGGGGKAGYGAGAHHSEGGMRRRNITVAVEFLLALGMDTAQQDLSSLDAYLRVAKSITLYLASVSPHSNPTVNLLIDEMRGQVREEDPRPEASDSAPMLLFSSALAGEPLLLAPSHPSHPNHPSHPSRRTVTSSSEGLPQPPSRGLTTTPTAASTSSLASIDRERDPAAAAAPAPGGGAGGAAVAHSSARTTSGTDLRLSPRSTAVAATAGGIVHEEMQRVGSADDAAAGLQTSQQQQQQARGTGTASDAPRPPWAAASSAAASSSASAAAHAAAARKPRSGPPQAAASLPPAVKVPTRQAHMPHFSEPGPVSVRHRQSAAASRALLTRPELALCLLAEVAFDHGQDLVELPAEPSPSASAPGPGPGSPGPQLPLLLHCCILAADHEQQVVASHGLTLLLHLLYASLELLVSGGRDADDDGYDIRGAAAAATGGTREDAEGVEVRKAACACLIRFLLRMRGSRLWGRDEMVRDVAGAAQLHSGSSDAASTFTLDPAAGPSLSALSTLVQSALSALELRVPAPRSSALVRGSVRGSIGVSRTRSQDMGKDDKRGRLQVLWSEVAFDWALGCCGRHFARRSLQVYRSLQPPLSLDSLFPQLAALHCCLARGGGDALGAPHLETALGIMDALQDQVCLAPAPRLLLFPQLLWCCLALLHTRSTLLYTAALRLLLRLLCKLDPRQPAVQAVLLAAAPAGALSRDDEGGHNDSEGGGLLGMLLPLLHSSPASAAGGAWDQPETWELGPLLLGSPSSPSSKDFATSRSQDQQQGQSARTSGSLASPSSQRHQCLAMQQLLLRGLLGAPPGSAAQLLALQAVERLAVVSEPPSARFAAPGGGALMGGVDSALASDQDRKDTMGSGATTTSSGRTGRAAAGSADGADSDAAAAALLCASSSHYDSLKRHTRLRLDGQRALLGPWRSQLVVSLLGLLPLLVADALGGGSGGGGGGGAALGNEGAAAAVAREEEGQEALAVALRAVGEAAARGGGGAMVAVGQCVAELAAWRAAPWSKPQHSSGNGAGAGATGIEGRVRELCVALKEAGLLPAYSAAYLHHCLDLLTAAAATLGAAGEGSMTRGPRMQAAALLMLRCMFEGSVAAAAASEGQHEAAAAVRVTGAAEVMVQEPGLLNPILALMQGPLSGEAQAAVAALLSFARASGVPAAALQLRQQQQQLRKQQPGAAGGDATAPGFVSTSSLPATLAPLPCNVAARLRHVLDAADSGFTRRCVAEAGGMLPFLGS